MWPNQDNPLDAYQAQQQMQRGMQLQQMALQQPGTGLPGALMAILGGFGGRRMEDRGYERLQKAQNDQREQDRLKREMLVQMLSGKDPMQAIGPMLDLGMDKEAIELATSANKPKHVSDSILANYDPASIDSYLKSGSYGDLKPKAGKSEVKLPTGWMWGEDGRAMQIPGTESFHADRSARARTPGTVVTIGANGQPAIPLSKPSQNNAQEQLMNLNVQLGQIRKLGETFADEYLTAGGKIANTYREYADWSGVLPISESGKEKLRNQTQFQNRAMRMYLDFRRFTTGSAASNQEDQRIMDSMFNMSQSPEQFKASLRMFGDDIQNRLGLYQNMVQSGIPVHEVQSIFRDTPLLQNIDPATAPSSDAQVMGQQMTRQVEDLRGSAPNAAPGKPSLEAFLSAAREDNPGVPEADLIAYYNQTYR